MCQDPITRLFVVAAFGFVSYFTCSSKHILLSCTGSVAIVLTDHNSYSFLLNHLRDPEASNASAGWASFEGIYFNSLTFKCIVCNLNGSSHDWYRVSISHAVPSKIKLKCTRIMSTDGQISSPVMHLCRAVLGVVIVRTVHFRYLYLCLICHIFELLGEGKQVCEKEYCF